MLVDVLSIALKSLMYLTLFQAAGSVFYLATFGSRLTHSVRGVHDVATTAAISCIALTLLYAGAQAARMSGELSGILDGRLQRLVWHSMEGFSAGLRIFTMTVVCIVVVRRSARIGIVPVACAAAGVLTLVLVGHVSAHAQRWLLAPLLASHLIVAAWWFGSLIPLGLLARREDASTSLRVVNRFSRIAGWLVPGLGVAGLTIGVFLTGGSYSVHDPYDLALTGKLLGFSMLLGIAALNRWRLGPNLGTGCPGAVRIFEVSLAIEYVLVAALIVLTATMTSFYSPETM
jgi:putative copper export protein